MLGYPCNNPTVQLVTVASVQKLHEELDAASSERDSIKAELLAAMKERGSFLD